jgi:hypothetical protein
MEIIKIQARTTGPTANIPLVPFFLSIKPPNYMQEIVYKIKKHFIKSWFILNKL